MSTNHAQTAEPRGVALVAIYLQPGDKVTASPPDGDFTEGRVVSLTDDGCFAQPDEGGPVFGATWHDVVLHLENYQPEPVE